MIMAVQTVTIPLDDYTKLSLAAADGERLKGLLKEAYKQYTDVSHQEIRTLCGMFGLFDEGE